MRMRVTRDFAELIHLWIWLLLLVSNQILVKFSCVVYHDIWLVSYVLQLITGVVFCIAWTNLLFLVLSLVLIAHACQQGLFKSHPCTGTATFVVIQSNACNFRCGLPWHVIGQWWATIDHPGVFCLACSNLLFLVLGLVQNAHACHQGLSKSDSMYECGCNAGNFGCG